jgi:hypothetical protein
VGRDGADHGADLASCEQPDISGPDTESFCGIDTALGRQTPPAAPAVTLVEVSRLYGPDFLIEIEAIAAA